MTNNKRNRYSRAAPEATLDELIRELTEEAMITGGAVWVFGPDGSTEQLVPSPRIPLRGPTLFPRRG